MKLIKPSYTILEQESGLEGIYKAIERAGRVCCRSEDKITKDSAKPFVDRMIKSQHYAMLEHGTVYLKIPFGKMLDCGEFENETLSCWFVNNPYSLVRTGMIGSEDYWYVTSNYRVLIENDMLYTLQYLCEPTEFHEKRVCVHFICDRGILAEFTRHRVFSFAAESTRYCNYSKDKFGNEVTFIIPFWLDIITEEDELHLDGDEDSICYPEDVYTTNFLYTLRYTERVYIDLLTQWEKRVPDKRFKSGFRYNPWTPQQARAILPNALKTELVMTGFVSDWKHFFRLRSRIAGTGKPHPQASELADPLYKEFIKRGYINESSD